MTSKYKRLYFELMREVNIVRHGDVTRHKEALLRLKEGEAIREKDYAKLRIPKIDEADLDDFRF